MRFHTPTVSARLWATPIRTWLIVFTLALIATLALAACGGTTTTTPTTGTTPTTAAQPTTATTSTQAQVKIVEQNGQYAFSPTTITIPKGAQVVWMNTSDAPHTVTSDTSAFASSQAFSQNQTFMMTFNTAGTYTYHCSIHPYMKATIVVQ
jgi:plastocyanin